MSPFYSRRGGASRRAAGRGLPIRFIIGLVIAGVALFSYYGARQVNPVTNEVQHVSLTPEQEIALGLQAVPEMTAQFGGLDPDPEAQARVDTIGEKLVKDTVASGSPYTFEFHVLDDDQTVNAFALPGGQIFITEALLKRLETDGQLAGVLAHEVGHVVERHGAQQLAKQNLLQGLTGAAVVATYDPENPNSRYGAAVAAAIGQLVSMKYGRGDELESDRWGVRLTAESGYDPTAMVRVMEILNEAAQGPRPPEFLSTHPNPENRISRIQEAISKEYPQGLPEGLIP